MLDGLAMPLASIPIALAAWVHQLDPIALDLPGPVDIRWYGLSYLFGFFLGYLLIRRVTRVGRSTLKPAEVADLVLTLAMGIVLGGRLGYVVFYEPSLLGFVNSPPYWGVLAVNRGGMASHGGMIGMIVAAYFYAWRNGHRLGHLLDLGAFGGPIGVFFGRIANFVNGELYGRPCDPQFPLAVKFPQEMHGWIGSPDHVQQVAALRDAAPGIGIEPETWMTWVQVYLTPPDQEMRIKAFNFLWDGVHKMIVATGRGDATVVEALRPLLTPRYPSQLFQAVGEGLVVAVAMFIVWAKPRKPFVVSGWFCMVYAIVRIIGEVFREPDEHIKHLEFASTGITRGQWLSVALLAAGIAMTVVASRQNAEKLGGWLPAKDDASPDAADARESKPADPA